MTNVSPNKLVILTGPTAVGKTKLSILLAKKLNADIISADSMQIYKGMDIGSAKITADEMQGVRHYLIDVLDPHDDFNVVKFQKMARKAIDEIYSRSRLPLIVGGTGFYIQALLYDIDFEECAEDSLFRAKLEREAAENGSRALWERLKDIDPASADAIHENNSKRIIRALEYNHLTGGLISKHNEEQRQKKSPFSFKYFVLTRDRAELYKRIDQRVDEMMRSGLLDEVIKLKANACTRDMVSMQGLGYKELLDYLDGLSTLDEAVYKIKQATRHFAKRQLTWFRREQDVVWVETDGRSPEELAEELAEECKNDLQLM